jgi:hypothetical protein
VDKELVQIIYELLPGFLAAWLFYGLIVKVVLIGFAWLCLKLGRLYALGVWSPQVEFVWSMIFGLALGVTLSAMANRDTAHRWLRDGRWIKKLKITKKNSFPSEWFSAFQREDRFVVLHLKDGRRLYGWPEEWPNEPTGHFLITCPSWLGDDGTKTPMPQIHRMVLGAEHVEWVEQLTTEDERTMTPDQILAIQQPLLALHQPTPEQESKPTEVSDNGRATVAK